MNDDPQEAGAHSLFEDRSKSLMSNNDAAAVARATQEIQAALVIAQRFPRDEIAVKAQILTACRRRGLAEVAEYEYSRGGTKITGPSIDLLRAIASRWGRIRWGWDEVERFDGESRVRCWAWDMQSLAYAERTFSVEHWRDTNAGGYKLEDGRDIYEHVANNAARRVRACLEEIIDTDLVADAIDQCRKTLKEGEKIPLKERCVKMVMEFEANFHVSKAEIELRLGHALDAISENQFASLRRIYKSLSDGVGKKEDYFKPVPLKPDLGGGEKTPESNGPSKPVAQTSHQSATADAKTPADVTPGAPAGSSPPPATPEPQGIVYEGGFNPLLSVRNHCKMSKVKEADLLAYFVRTGSTDGSASSLEEVHMAKPELLRSVVENWSTIAPNIKAGK